VFGGYDGKDRLNTIEVYNPELNKWTVLSTKLDFPLSNAAAVSDNDNIYILGGGWS
jgi:N-acetylneuraminic acid mutarotase